jgi:ACS family hexuronate transporter-like MFS transporter
MSRAVAATSDARANRTIHGLRWLMIGLIFLATVINYIDRQTMAVLKTSISADLGLSNPDYAVIQNAFLLAYAASQMISGRVYDVVGTRVGFVLSIVIWSLAAIAHAGARGMAGLATCRFVLGFGEAGNWPGAAKAIGEWFPARERALAMGIFNTGAAVGGALSPPLIAALASALGWRAAFVVTGALGFAWLGAWLLLYRLPEAHPRLGAEERAYILEGREPERGGTADDGWRPGWGELLTYRQTWAVVVGRFLTDPIWWLYVFWLPSYFQEARGFSLAQIGWSAWFPFLAAGLGALSGGWASGHLVARGWSVDAARKTVMAAGALLIPAGILAMRADSAYVALAWMGVVLFGFQIWINNLMTVPSDCFPARAVASVAGLGGTAAAVASALYNWNTGRVVEMMGYTPVFVASGVLGPLGLAAVLLLAGRIEPIRARP